MLEGRDCESCGVDRHDFPQQVLNRQGWSVGDRPSALVVEQNVVQRLFYASPNIPGLPL